MFGYTVGKNNDVSVIITLEIPEDATTDVNRDDIVDASCAKYKTNKAKVIKIEDSDGLEYDIATSKSYCSDYYYVLGYALNDFVKDITYENDFEEYDEDNICYSDIDFYLTKTMAQRYNTSEVDVKNGVYEVWYPNGQKSYECTYLNGNQHGLSQRWAQDGSLIVKVQYRNGRHHGLYLAEHRNGKKRVEYNCVDGRIEGLYQEWHENGSVHVTCMYVNGKKEGPYKKYYDDGEEDIYGTVYQEYNYKDGNIDGVWKQYTNWGYLELVRNYKHGLIV